MRQFAITDIHGCNRSFNALLDQIGLTTADELFLLGDYIDRGPDSKGVLETIIGLQSTGYKVRCMMGNHDESMRKARLNRIFYEEWISKWGGQQTLESFETIDLEEVPQHYWEFLESLELYIETGAFILAHAGLNFHLLNPFSNKTDLLFIRDWYGDIDYGWLGDRCIVHGHTPVTTEQCEALLQNIDNHRVIDIDTGCFSGTRLPGKGYLTAFNMTNRQLTFQKCLDNVGGY